MSQLRLTFCLLFFLALGNFAIAQDAAPEAPPPETKEVPAPQTPPVEKPAEVIPIPEQKNEAIATTESYCENNVLNCQHFMLPQGSFELTPTLGSSLCSVTSYSSVPTTSMSNTINAIMISTYGINDFLSFGLSQSMDQTNTMTNSSTTNASGFAEPIFKLNMRLLGGTQGKFFLNALFNVSPNQGASIKGSNVLTGNDLRGGDLNSLGFITYFVMGSQELSLEALYSYYGPQNYNYQNPAANSYTNAFNAIEGILNYRYHFSNTSHLDFMFDFVAPYSVYFYLQSGANSLYLNHQGRPLGQLTYGFLVSPDFLFITTLRNYTVTTTSTLSGITQSLQETDLYVGIDTVF